jgi:hypothetical protein
MPITVTIEAGTRKRDGTKGESAKQDFLFSPQSEALVLLKQDKVPLPWDSWKQFYDDAVAHRVVQFQQTIRPKNGKAPSGPRSARKQMLAE